VAETIVCAYDKQVHPKHTEMPKIIDDSGDFMNEMRLLCLEIGGGGGGFQPASTAHDNIIVIRMRRECDGM